MSDYDDILEDSESASERRELNDALPALTNAIQDRWNLARQAKADVEQRWLQAYNDYRGVYQSTGAELGGEIAQSRVFLKIAKTKTLAAYGQLIEVVFPTNKGVPIEIFPTPKPMGIAKYAHLPTPKSGAEKPAESPIPKEFDVGFSGDTVMSGASQKFPEGNWEAGPGENGKVEIEPARIAAFNMNLTIQDQLLEASADRVVRSTLFDACLYGTGILKGPLTKNKEIADWHVDVSTDADGNNPEYNSEYKPRFMDVPDLSSVSVWDCFPDPAATNSENMEWLIQRHKFSASQMRGLRSRPHFNIESIAKCLDFGPNYVEQDYESVVKNSVQDTSRERWEVLEYWGVLDVFMAEEIGLELPDDVSLLDQASFNVWICGNEILRVVVNPFKPGRIPYHIMPYEFDPSSIWGVGVPENMADATSIMNGHMRLAIDNLALSGSVMLDVNEDLLVEGQSMDIEPGKIWRSRGQVGAKAINAVTIPNQTQQHIFMLEKAKQLSDEESGIPSMSQGISGQLGQPKTAAGTSMLMGAASVNTKTVIKNLDDFLLRPLGQSMFFWNMQFNPDPAIQGDLSVKALGTASVMQREVQSQRLTQFLQVSANPGLAPFVNFPYIVEELAKAMEIDPERAVNSPEQAMIQAQVMGASGQQIGGQQQSAGGGTSAPAPEGPQQPAPPGQGNTGNGNATIGTGKVPVPGEPEFSGSVG